MTKNREKLLAYGAIGLFALFVADRLVFSPLVNAWKDRTTRIAELTQNLSRGTLLLDREQAIRNRWAAMKSDSLPANVSVAETEIYKSAERWAQESQVTFNGIAPQRRRADDEYPTLEYQLDASGSMETITKFLFELEKDPLPLKVENLEIAARDSTGQVLSLGVRFSGLLLTPEEE